MNRLQLGKVRLDYYGRGLRRAPVRWSQLGKFISKRKLSEEWES